MRGHSQEHRKPISGYSTEEDVSLSSMLASGNTQSRLGRTFRRVCATVSFCSCNKTSEINQLVKIKRLFWLTILEASDSGLLAMLLLSLW